MDKYFEIIKDFIVVLTPIIAAYLSYKNGKKTRKDIKIEIEKMKEEKEAETNQMIKKISAELSSQEHLISWQNSMPQTNEYLNGIDVKRRGNVSNLHNLVVQLEAWLVNYQPSRKELNDLSQMLGKITLPYNEEELFPYEIPILLEYRALVEKIGKLISEN